MVDNKKKILYIIPSLNVGGLERQLLHHLRYLLDTGEYKISVITLYDSPSDINYIKSLPKEIDLFEIKISSRFSLRGVSKVIKKIFSVNPDVVISSTFPANTISRLTKPFRSGVYIAREHNVYPERTFLHNVTNHILSYKIFCDVYLAVSKEAARSAEKQAWLKEGKVKVIQNGIDLKHWDNLVKSISETKEEIRHNLSLPLDKKIILNVARFKKKKNQKLLISAFNEFYKNNKDYVLVLVGGGEEKADLNNLANSLPCSNAVYFFDRQVHIEKFYSISSLFALASTEEGFPNVLLEALYFNLPIVSTNAPGVCDVVIDKRIGYIVGSDKELYSKALSAVLNQTDTHQQFRREFMQTNFAIDKIVSKYIDLFN